MQTGAEACAGARQGGRAALSQSGSLWPAAPALLLGCQQSCWATKLGRAAGDAAVLPSRTC